MTRSQTEESVSAMRSKKSYDGFLNPPGECRVSDEGERVWLFVRSPTDTVGAIVMEPYEMVATDRTYELESIRALLFVPNRTFRSDYGFFYDEMVSRPILAVFLMGAFEQRYHEHVYAYTYDDLTDDGKAFYDFIKMLYPESELYLATALET